MKATVALATTGLWLSACGDATGIYPAVIIGAILVALAAWRGRQWLTK